MNPVMALYQDLFAAYGPQHWWPARTRAEMMIGAILTQNTAWTQVEKALSNLRKNRALCFQTLEQTPCGRLEEWIRPAGYFRRKAASLHALAALLNRTAEGSLARFFRRDTAELRALLLSVQGIGPETADSILLYAGNRPVFVVDLYTRRLLAEWGFATEAQAPYDEVACFFTGHLPSDPALFNEFHALIVRYGKEKRGGALGLRRAIQDPPKA